MPDIEALEIARSKTLADSNKYFSLFEKYLNDSFNSCLLFEIGNEDVIVKIIEKNPNASWFIYDNPDLKDILKAVFQDYNKIKFCSDQKFKPEEVFNKMGTVKFDKIIMNPPYNGALHLKILNKATNYLTKFGHIVNLCPGNWLGKHSYYSSCFLKYRQILNNHISSIEKFDHQTSNKLFELGNQLENLIIIDYSNEKTNNIDMIKYGFKDDNEFSLITKILGNTKKLVWRNKEFTKFHPEKQKFEVALNQWSGGKTFKDACISKRKRVLVAQFNTQNELNNFLNSLDTNFMNWFYNTIIKSGDCKIHIYGFMMPDYSHPWTDEDFYKFFNITEDEQKIIEKTMERYKNK